VGIWETFRPLRPLELPNGRRWALHIVLAATGQAVTFLMPISAAVVALRVQDAPWALLGRTLPFWAQCVIALLLLDCLRWYQHFLMHRIGFLWRIHRVHHSDPDYDLTTTLRFHPLEVVVLQGTYLGVVALLAPPAILVLLLEAVQLIQNFIGHANTALPDGVERGMRRFLVTPSFHRVHHSQEYAEQNSNFGIAFPFWDFLFGTYRAEPALGHKSMRIGLKDFDLPCALDLPGLLLMPLRRLKESGGSRY
jgi:sterol desaturase/sphingolipid hydroxylase (fatty acid hydroxylase superfamily)